MTALNAKMFMTPGDTKVAHVVPAQWGPYVDILAMLKANGELVYDTSDPAALDPGGGGPGAVRVFWSLVEIPSGRSWAAVAVFAEALGDASGGTDHLAEMLPGHIEHWERFRVVVRNYDAVVVHTPAMAQRVRPFVNIPVFVVPLGWAPDVWGKRPADRPRHSHYDLAWWGSPVGRRVEIFPQLETWCSAQGIRGVNLTGKFGRELIGTLDTVTAVVYVAHSKVASYSTWRLWQCLGADAPVISEPVGDGDAWPFTPDGDFTVVPWLDTLTAWSRLERAVAAARDGTLASTLPRRPSEMSPVKYTLDEVEFHFWRGVLTQARLAFEAHYG